MKRRNADTGKLRRPLKRTKITEGMYGNSMLYLKFVMLWASIVLADYMLEFRFEFLWPFWMMLRSVYDSYKYQGLAFSVFFICIALTSDMICFFFVPVQYIFFAASTYVWVQYVWYSFADKGICLPTVVVCCFIVYMEGIRGVGVGAGAGAGWMTTGSRGLAAHAVGFPAVTLGVGVKAYVGRRLRARTQRHVRKQNDFYFQLMRDALPVSGVPSCLAECIGECECNTAPATAPAAGAGVGATPPPVKAANGAAKRRIRSENGHCAKEKEILLSKLEQLEQHLERKQAKERDKSQNHVTISHTALNSVGNSHGSVGNSHGTVGNSHGTVGNSHHQVGNSHHQVGNSHAHSNGVASGPGYPPDDDDKHIHSKGGAKSSKYDKKEANTLKEERRKHKNRDKDKESCDSHKSTEQTKEQISNSKEVESTTESVKIKEFNVNGKEKDRDRETRERDREARERDKEARDKEREREQREKEARTNRETIDELRRVRTELATSRSELAAAKTFLAGARSELATAKAELTAARAAETEAKKQLAAEKQKRLERHTHTKSCSWGRERAALERRLENERRARHSAEQQLQQNQDNGWCQRCACGDSEAGALRRELTRARDAHRQLQRDLQQAHDQVRSLESANSSTEAGGAGGADAGGGGGAGAQAGWAARAGQLERALSAETRVKLDLLSALGDANRRMHIQDSVINRQEKELEELKAQMLAVMPTEFVGTVGVAGSVSVSKLRLSDNSPLDPNATVYTPKQLCSDA